MVTIITILVIGLIIVIHEFGHFLAARLCGVRVNIFSIGLGPTLLGYKFGNTTYKLSLIPLGGYVRLQGFPENTKDDPESFGNHPKFQQAIILAAGAGANMLSALVGAFLVLWLYGDMPLQRAVEVSGTTTIKVINLNIDGLNKIVRGKTDLMTGPVGMVKASQEAKNLIGMEAIALIAFSLSISLGTINLLPIPALDGGHLAVLGLEVIMRRTFSAQTKLAVGFAGLAFLLCIFALTTIQDLYKVFNGISFLPKSAP